MFSILGIRINFHVSSFFAIGLISYSLSTDYFPLTIPHITDAGAWATGLFAAIMVFVSILGHELAHCLVAMNRGIPVKSITLFVFGGVAQFGKEMPTPRTEFFVAVAGPVASLTISAFLYLFFKPDAVIAYLVIINLIIGIVNFTPAFPMDGGRIARAIWWKITNNYLRSTELASLWGITWACLMIIGGLFYSTSGNFPFGSTLLVTGIFLATTSGSIYSQVRGSSLMKGNVSDIMVPDCSGYVVSSNISVEEFIRRYYIAHGFPIFPAMIEDDSIAGYVRVDRAFGVLNEKVKIRELTEGLNDDIIIVPSLLLKDCLKKMFLTGNECFFVYDDGRFVGLITKAAVMRALVFVRSNKHNVLIERS